MSYTIVGNLFEASYLKRLPVYIFVSSWQEALDIAIQIAIDEDDSLFSLKYASGTVGISSIIK